MRCRQVARALQRPSSDVTPAAATRPTSGGPQRAGNGETQIPTAAATASVTFVHAHALALPLLARPGSAPGAAAGAAVGRASSSSEIDASWRSIFASSLSQSRFDMRVRQLGVVSRVSA